VAMAPSEGGFNPWPHLAILILVALLVFAWGAWKTMESKALAEEVVQKQTELKKYEGAREKVRELERFKEEYTIKVEQIKKLKQNQSLLVSLMNHLVEVLPEGAWYETLDQKGGEISLTGKARSIKTISSLYDKMVSLEQFTNVLMGEVKQINTRGGEEVYDFKMTFTFVPEGKEPQAEGDVAQAGPAVGSGSPSRGA